MSCGVGAGAERGSRALCARCARSWGAPGAAEVEADHLRAAEGLRGGNRFLPAQKLGAQEGLHRGPVRRGEGTGASESAGSGCRWARVMCVRAAEPLCARRGGEIPFPFFREGSCPRCPWGRLPYREISRPPRRSVTTRRTASESVPLVFRRGLLSALLRGWHGPQLTLHFPPRGLCARELVSVQ